MKYEDITRNKEILEYYERGNAILGALGFTDHSIAHTGLVAVKAAQILEEFGYGEKEQELAKIAGFMHDIGNAVNRHHHAEYGALLANEILKETDLSLEDRVRIVSAIANHDESDGVAADLFIHRNTASYRINRIREIFGFDIKDSEFTFNFLYSYKLYRMKQLGLL